MNQEQAALGLQNSAKRWRVKTDAIPKAVSQFKYTTIGILPANFSLNMKKYENIVDTAFHSLATSKVKGSIACRLSSNLYYCKKCKDPLHKQRDS